MSQLGPRFPAPGPSAPFGAYASIGKPARSGAVAGAGDAIDMAA
jgi:hypothetical protein